MVGKRLIWFLVVLSVSIAMFFFLKEVFSGNLIVRRYIFKIGNFELRWYSTLIASGIFLSYILARRRFELEGRDPSELDAVLVWGIVLGILFGRLYYVVFNWDFYSKHPSEILKTWHGGMAIHGGIIGAILAAYIYTKVGKRTFTFVEGLDILAWLLPLGQAIGRWGNFFNYEAFGYPTNLPWGMFVPEWARPAVFAKYSKFHPTFLYESLWDLMVFFILTSYMKDRKKPGEVISLYLVLYSMGRIVVERFRTDSLYLGSIRIAQLVSAVAIFIGVFWYFSLTSEEPFGGE